VYPVASSQIAPRPDERRRNPRHTASAIVYVHLGPDNGGIIINLGIDGVACQAARKLNAKKNTILNVRLRGSGLDVNLIGEIIWQGASQKEIGICFKDLPAGQQQEIANWIAQQEQPSKTSEFDDLPQPKPMHAMPGIFAAGEKFVPHSLSAASTTPQAKPAGPPSSADVEAIDPCLPAPVESASGISAATPRLDIVSPIQDGHVPSDGLAANAQGRNADSLAPPESFQAEQPSHIHPPPELSPIRRPRQAPADNTTPIVLAKEPIPPARKALPKASAEFPGKTELRKTDEIKPISQDLVSSPQDSLPAATAVERWIPPALLVAWRRGNRQQKILLAAIPAACLLIFALIFTLAVDHIESSSRRSAEAGSLQQSIARPATASVSADSTQTRSLPAPPAPSATPQPQADQPSLFDRFAVTFLGYKPEKPEVDAYIQIPIDKDHVRVQVWTSKSSGYYYCTDSPYYTMVRPGSFMAQRDALQSGYQPKLGQFCN